MGGFHQFRYDATGLKGKRMRLVRDLPTNDAGDPQEELMGISDVIALDDKHPITCVTCCGVSTNSPTTPRI
jgi:hypothetical protein